MAPSPKVAVHGHLTRLPARCGHFAFFGARIPAGCPHSYPRLNRHRYRIFTESEKAQITGLSMLKDACIAAARLQRSFAIHRVA
jgi:hypothetical protein